MQVSRVSYRLTLVRSRFKGHGCLVYQTDKPISYGPQCPSLEEKHPENPLKHGVIRPRSNDQGRVENVSVVEKLLELHLVYTYV
jgi:hypothetical protein